MLSKVILVTLLACAANAALNDPCDPNIAGACSDIANSHCDTTSLTCVCDDRNLATSTGTCDGVLGRSCSIDFGATCNLVPYALCQGPTCECTNTYLNSDSKTACLVPAYNSHCLEDAQCSVLGPASCVGEKCVCDAGFVSNGNGPCYAVSIGLDENCEIDAQCLGYDPHAECVFNLLGSKCKCRGGYVPNLSNNACVISANKVGDVCEVIEQCQSFDENARCTSGACACNSGYAASLDNVNCIAESGFGTSCQQDAQCSGATVNSGCIDGLCQCLPGFIYDGATCAAGKRYIRHK